MIRDKSIKASITHALIMAFVVLVTISALAPIVHTLALSFSSMNYAVAGAVTFLPRGFTLDAYNRIMNDSQFLRSFGISVRRVFIGGGLSMILTVMMAYPLSKEKERFKFRNAYMWTLVFTMLFSGGLIPWYMNIRRFNLLDSFWALVFPSAIQVFNILLVMNYFRGLPKQLEEAATIDGAGQWTMLLRIFLPVSLPVLATVSLFTMVTHWNSFFDGLILMNTPRNWPLQTYIQQLNFQLNPGQMSGMTPDEIASFMNVTGINFNAAKIFVSMVPVLFVYPFLQKFFISGIVLGSVKE